MKQMGRESEYKRTIKEKRRKNYQGDKVKSRKKKKVERKLMHIGNERGTKLEEK